MFGESSDDLHELAVIDYNVIKARSGLTFEDQPADWEAAARRLQRMVATFQEAAIAPKLGDGSSAARLAWREAGISIDDPAKAKATKTDVAHRRNASGAMVKDLASDAVVAAEQVATQRHTAVLEVRRIVDTDYGDSGGALIFSNERVMGTLRGDGKIASTVTEAREWLLEWITHRVEEEIGPSRVQDVRAGANSLAMCVLCGDFDAEEYRLVVKLLGGRKPMPTSKSSSLLSEGEWGQHAEAAGGRWKADVPNAMRILGEILGTVHGDAGGGPLGDVPGYGLHELAQQTTGTLTSANTEDVFVDLFRRAARAHELRRTRRGSPMVDWPQLVLDTGPRKVDKLLGEEAVDRRTDLRFAELAALAGAKRAYVAGDKGTPAETRTKGTPGTPGEPGSRKAKREARQAEYNASKAAGDKGATTNAAANAAANAKAVADLAAVAGGGAPPKTSTAGPTHGKVPTWAPGSIDKWVDRVNHMGAVEHFDLLMQEAHPTVRGKGALACAHFSMGQCRAGCESCAAQTALGANAPAIPAGLIAKVKAAATPSVAAKITKG